MIMKKNKLNLVALSLTEMSNVAGGAGKQEELQKAERKISEEEKKVAAKERQMKY